MIIVLYAACQPDTIIVIIIIVIIMTQGGGMQFVMICLIGIAVLVSPCTYDTDPREPSAVAAIIAKMSSAGFD
jgi:hypothetical protein